MSAQKRRTSKRKKKNDVSIVGDLFRILFAVSMLIVAILAAFYVFKNVNGFKLPDLTTAAPTETSQPITIQSDKETKKKETSAAETTSRAETSASAADETVDGGGDDAEKEIQSAEEQYDYDESDYTDENEEPIGGTEKGPGVTGDVPVVPTSAKATEKQTEKSTEKPKETAAKPKETAKPDAEIVDGPGETMPAETVEGGYHGPV